MFTTIRARNVHGGFSEKILDFVLGNVQSFSGRRNHWQYWVLIECFGDVGVRIQSFTINMMTVNMKVQYVYMTSAFLCVPWRHIIWIISIQACDVIADIRKEKTSPFHFPTLMFVKKAIDHYPSTIEMYHQSLTPSVIQASAIIWAMVGPH